MCVPVLTLDSVMYIILQSVSSLTYLALEMEGRLLLGEGAGGGASLGGAGTILPYTSIMSVPSRSSAGGESEGKKLIHNAYTITGMLYTPCNVQIGSI